MIKKIFIVAIVFFLLAASGATYLLFFYHSANNQSSAGQPTGNGFQSFPIASTNNQTLTTSTTTGSASIGPTSSVTIKTLTQLYASPVAGAGIGSNKSGIFVHFTDRATGHMYSISLAPSSPGTMTELSDRTIPTMYRSLWVDSSTTILRYLNNSGSVIKTYSATLITPKSSLESTTPNFLNINGSFLPDNIGVISGNPAGNKIFYLIVNANNAIGKIANNDGSQASTIFSSAISDWGSQWPNSSTIALTTKPSFAANGYLYFLSTKNGSMKRILGNIPGLVTNVDPSLTFIAYSNSTPSLFIYNIKTGKTQDVNTNTLADKCTWSSNQTGILYCAVPQNIPGGKYPDSWYQGMVSFSDNIDMIDANNGQVVQLADISQQAGQPIDAENLMVSPDNSYLIFLNKIDLSLWALRLQPGQ